MPGLTLRRGTPPTPFGPDPRCARTSRTCSTLGQGFVFLHHALAGWPGWPDWADVLGGRYHYAPARLRGRDLAGLRLPLRALHGAARSRIRSRAGIEAFELDDELYCCPVFEHEVVPLLRATDVDAGEFQRDLPRGARDARRRPSALAAPAGQRPDRLGQARRPQPAGLPPARRRPGDLRRPELPPPARQRARLGRLPAARAWAADRRSSAVASTGPPRPRTTR